MPLCGRRTADLIPDLNKDDFTLEEDQQPQVIQLLFA